MTKVVQNNSTSMKIDNEILSKKIENLEIALALCQGNDDMSKEDSVTKLASDSIIKDLLS